MQNIQDQFNKIFKDIELNQIEKDKLLIVYSFCVYKNMLELFLNLLGNKTEFMNDLNNFFDKSMNYLSEDQKKMYSQVLQSTNSKTLLELMTLLSNEMPEEMKMKLQANLKELHHEN